jgi:hypothetical protein
MTKELVSDADLAALIKAYNAGGITHGFVPEVLQCLLELQRWREVAAKYMRPGRPYGIEEWQMTTQAPSKEIVVPNEVVDYIDKMFSGDTTSVEIRVSEWMAIKASIDAWRLIAQGRQKIIDAASSHEPLPKSGKGGDQTSPGVATPTARGNLPNSLATEHEYKPDDEWMNAGLGAYSAPPPGEGYSQEYADQMRTCLLHLLKDWAAPDSTPEKMITAALMPPASRPTKFEGQS